MQMMGRALDVKMLVLPGSAFRREHSTAVYFLKVPIRKLIVSFRLGVLLIVNRQVPFRILFESVQPNEFVLFLR